MELAIDDRVVHPIHGVGQVVEIKHQELIEGFEHYCTIQIPNKRMTLHIPMSKIEECGVRPTMSQDEMLLVLNRLQQTPEELPDNILKRQNQIKDKLKAGDPLLVAEAVRDLTGHKDRLHLTKADSELLTQAQELLATEIAAVAKLKIAKAEKKIKAALKLSIESSQIDEN